MSTKIRKELFWGSVIGLFVFAPCWFFFLNQRGYETPFDNLEDIPKRTVDAVLYGKEDPGEDASNWERLMSYDLLSPPEEDEQEESGTEEDTTEADAEVERLANWKANFPYQPTTDPDVLVTEEMLRPGNMADPPMRTHVFLRGFFENEARFTAQFEQLYHILEEHGRGDNPIAAGNIFNCLWEYHQYSQKNPDEVSNVYSHRMGRYCTNAEVTESFREGIAAHLYDGLGAWPDRELMPETEAMAIRDRIVAEIEGMDKIPDPDFVYDLSYEEELKEGFSPLVIRPGWQKAYDEWSENWEKGLAKDRANRQLSVGEGNVLLANGKPIVYDKREHVASITAPDGFQVPLNLDADGKVIIPTPSQIEEMKANGEGEWVELPEWPAPPPPQLTEEEWKMQEALRQLEEAARQQE